MACCASGSKRFMCCGGELCSFNVGMLSDPWHSIHEMRCCVTGKNADGFGYSSTANEIAAGLGKRLDGKLVVVTGASSGIGKHAARAFYETGATVVMACRTEAKARDAMKWIEETANTSSRSGNSQAAVGNPQDGSSAQGKGGKHALVGEAQAKRQMQSIIERRRADEKASIERNKAKGNRRARDSLDKLGNEDVYQKEAKDGKAGGKRLVFLKIDLASLESVKTFADAVAAMPEPLAVLMCNAGIMTVPFTLTGDGFESQFQINYLSHYYLTMLLVDKLKANPDGARVVNQSSISAAWVPFPACCGGCCSRLCCFGPVDFSGEGAWPAKSSACCAYEPTESYAYSKAAQVIFGSELDSRVFRGTGVKVVSAAPGLLNPTTGIHQDGQGSMCLQFMFTYTPLPCMLKVFCVHKELDLMASSSVYAALSDQVQRGDYYRNNLKCKIRGPAGNPKWGPPLWALSAKCVKDKVGVDVPNADAPKVQAMHYRYHAAIIPAKNNDALILQDISNSVRRQGLWGSEVKL